MEPNVNDSHSLLTNGSVDVSALRQCKSGKPKFLSVRCASARSSAKSSMSSAINSAQVNFFSLGKVFEKFYNFFMKSRKGLR